MLYRPAAWVRSSCLLTVTLLSFSIIKQHALQKISELSFYKLTAWVGIISGVHPITNPTLHKAVQRSTRDSRHILRRIPAVIFYLVRIVFQDNNLNMPKLKYKPMNCSNYLWVCMHVHVTLIFSMTSYLLNLATYCTTEGINIFAELEFSLFVRRSQRRCRRAQSSVLCATLLDRKPPVRHKRSNSSIKAHRLKRDLH